MFAMSFLIVFLCFSLTISFQFNEISNNAQLPLSTKGSKIIDDNGKEIMLSCSTWFGAHMEEHIPNGLDVQSADFIAKRIASMKFNCVRLTFSSELYFSNPIVTNSSILAANPTFIGLHAMDIFDKAVEALTKNGIMVILNNHIGKAQWCCGLNDGEGLWYTEKYTQEMFIEMWRGLAYRYRSNLYVIGADLRNELRAANEIQPTWGTGDRKTDWALAATESGNEVLKISSHWLIIVEGLNFSNDLSGARKYPIKLDIENRLVYSPHDYYWQTNSTTYEEYCAIMESNWGFLGKETPLWLGEFGLPDITIPWWTWVRSYIVSNNMSYSYWAVDGEQFYGTDSGDGLLEMDYNTVRNPQKLLDLQAMMKNPLLISNKESY